jgi:hypothetical protein
MLVVPIAISSHPNGLRGRSHASAAPVSPTRVRPATRSPSLAAGTSTGAKEPTMTTQVRPATQTTPVSPVVFAVGGAAVSAGLTAYGTFKEDNLARDAIPWLFINLPIIVVATAVIFGLVARYAGHDTSGARTARTALILSLAAVATGERGVCRDVGAPGRGRPDEPGEEVPPAPRRARAGCRNHEPGRRRDAGGCLVVCTPVTDADRGRLAELTARPPESALCPVHAAAQCRIASGV